MPSRTIVALVAAPLCLGLGALPAVAAPTTVPNACLFGFDDLSRDIPLTYDGTASPAAVQPGGIFSVPGATAGAQLPAWIPEYGYNFGILKPGVNTLPATVWVALAGGGTTNAPQMQRLTTSGSTTITVDANAVFVSATPISVTVPLAETFWTAGRAGTAGVGQAGAGTIGPITLASGSSVTPLGSVFIEAILPGGLSFQLDCQPGTSSPNGASFTPAPAAPFATAAIDPDASPSGISRTVGVPARSLTLRGRTVRVPVRCTAATTCRGTVTVTTAKRVRVGRAAPALTPVARGRYAVPAGATRTLAVALTPKGRTLMASRSSVAVTVLADPVAGPSATRRLALTTPKERIR